MTLSPISLEDKDMLMLIKQQEDESLKSYVA